jgi:hypothetical protein
MTPYVLILVIHELEPYTNFTVRVCMVELFNI